MWLNPGGRYAKQFIHLNQTQFCHGTAYVIMKELGHIPSSAQLYDRYPDGFGNEHWMASRPRFAAMLRQFAIHGEFPSNDY